MMLIILRYLATFTGQTVLVLAMGMVWLSNAILFGGVGQTDPFSNGCGVGILNHVALTWTVFAVYGYPVTALLIVAFGFLASWATHGQHSIYTLLVFMAPIFGLVSQNLVGSIDALRLFGLLALPVAVAYLPGYFWHRRLTNCCTGRRA